MTPLLNEKITNEKTLIKMHCKGNGSKSIISGENGIGEISHNSDSKKSLTNINNKDSVHISPKNNLNLV